MDERSANLTRSLIVTAILMVSVFFLYNEVYEKPTREQWLKESGCDINPDRCSVPQGIGVFLIAGGSVLFMVWYFNWLEKKRIKNWRSYK